MYYNANGHVDEHEEQSIEMSTIEVVTINVHENRPAAKIIC